MKFPDFHEKLSTLGYQIILILLSLLKNCSFDNHKFVSSHLVLIFFDAAVGYLKVHIHARRVDCLTFLQHFSTFGFDLLKGNIGKISQANFCNTGISLGDITLDFGLGSSIEEGVS